MGLRRVHMRTMVRWSETDNGVGEYDLSYHLPCIHIVARRMCTGMVSCVQSMQDGSRICSASNCGGPVEWQGLLMWRGVAATPAAACRQTGVCPRPQLLRSAALLPSRTCDGKPADFEKVLVVAQHLLYVASPGSCKGFGAKPLEHRARQSHHWS